MKKKQILIIHGGTSFKTYEDYVAYLSQKEISIEKLLPRQDWKDTLAPALGEEYEIITPRMPNSTNARYAEWKLWFERIIEVLNDEIILIGHSLGGIFLAKYLSENICKKKIVAAILVAAPFDDSENADGKESLADFTLPDSLEQFMRQCGVIYLLHSKDDPVVPFTQFKKYQHALPRVMTMIFENKEHFNQKEFPEIIALIKAIFL